MKTFPTGTLPVCIRPVVVRLGVLWARHAVPVRRNGFPYKIVIVHGMWGNAEPVLPLAVNLAERGYESYVIDLRGHGLDSRPLRSVGFEEYRQDILEAVNAIGSDVVLIGYSMGALVGAWTAERCSEVKAFVGIASAPHRWMTLPLGTIRRMPKYVRAMISGSTFWFTKADARALLFNGLSDSVAADSFYELVSESGRAARDACFPPFVEKLGCLSLVIAFDDDRMVGGVEMQKKIAARIGASEVKVISGCHCALFTEEGASGVAHGIDSWLAAL